MTRCPQCGRRRRITPRLTDAKREQIARARMASLRREPGALPTLAEVARQFGVDHKTVTACVVWWITESRRRELVIAAGEP